MHGNSIGDYTNEGWGEAEETSRNLIHGMVTRYAISSLAERAKIFSK